MGGLIGDTFGVLFRGGMFLARGSIFRKEEGARFSSGREDRKLFHSSNRGVLIDGNLKRLSEKDSFEHIAIIAKSGGGKTAGYIIPNILERARQGDSLIVTDPSGEIHELTSGYMGEQGYRVCVLDPSRTETSIRFNPFDSLDHRHLQEINSICAALILSRFGNDKEPIWNEGAISLLKLFAKCLAYNAPQELTIPKLYSLIVKFGSEGSSLNDWMAEYGFNPLDDADTSIEDEWIAVLQSAKKTKMPANYASIARAALEPVAVRDIADILSGNDLDLDDIRKRKTILYVSFPAHKQEDYQFMIDVLYFRLFSVMMERRPTPKDLSVYCLLDEFGSSYIKGFHAIISNIRKYRVSLSMVFQTTSQIDLKYGKAANVIRGSIASYLVFNGADMVTAEEISRAIGKKSVTERNQLTHVVQSRREYNLLNADQIRTLRDGEVVFLSKNRFASILKIRMFFQHSPYLRLTKKRPVFG